MRKPHTKRAERPRVTNPRTRSAVRGHADAATRKNGSRAPLRGNRLNKIRQKVERLKNFELEVCGPHLMPDMTVALEVKAYAIELLLIRALSQEAMASLSMPERGFVLNVNHIHLAALIGDPEKVRVLFGELNDMRSNDTSPISLHTRTLGVLAERSIRFGGDEYRETDDLAKRYRLRRKLDGL